MFNPYEIILLFFFYSFCGWLWEVVLSIIQFRKLVNRGFLIGPFLPLYGFGGLIATLFFSKLDMFDGFFNIAFIFIGTSILCSILEYVTSWFMEALFHNRWWDYSNMAFNINGRICLIGSFAFGVVCTATILFINPLLRNILDMINMPLNVLKGIDLILIVLILIDSAISFKIINNFKNISDSVVEDSTDKITKQVKNTILNNYNIFYQRIVNSFPSMIIKNRLSLLRDKILNERKRIEKASYKLDIRKRKVKQMQKELDKTKYRGFKEKLMNLFKKNRT